MSADSNTTTAPSAAPAQAAAAAPAQAQAGSNAPPPEQITSELVKQTDLLKEQLKSAEKDKAENDKLKARLAQFEKLESERAAKYAEERKPQAQEYIAMQEKIQGKALDEELKKQILNTFANPSYKENADTLWKTHTHTQAVEASAKAEKEAMQLELEQTKANLAKLNDTLSKVGMHVGGMRASYAQSLSPAQSEAAKAAEEEAASRRMVGVNASRSEGLGLNEMMHATPAAWELPFLAKSAFPMNVGVNASASDYDPNKVIRQTVVAAREHPMLLDENGERMFPASQRYLHPQLFAFNCEKLGRNDDFSPYVQFNSDHTFVDEKRVDDFKSAAVPKLTTY